MIGGGAYTVTATSPGPSGLSTLRVQRPPRNTVTSSLVSRPEHRGHDEDLFPRRNTLRTGAVIETAEFSVKKMPIFGNDCLSELSFACKVV